jgi:translation initiation factor IF-2
MTKEKLEQKKTQEKKTLGLSDKKLGVNLQNIKVKAQAQDFSSIKNNKGTVVVVTKSKTTKYAGDNSAYDHLTNQERQNRFDALKHAEKEAISKNDIKISDTLDDVKREKDSSNSSVIKNLDHSDEKIEPKKHVNDAITENNKSQNKDGFKKKHEEIQKSNDDEEKKLNKKKKFLEVAKDKKKISLTQVFKLEHEEESIKTKVTTIKRTSRNKSKDVKKHQQDKIYKDVKIPESISAQELANRMSEKVATVIKGLMSLGVMATINQEIDADTAELVVQELGHRPIRVSDEDIANNLFQGVEDTPDSLKTRAPVVTIMGHVDHGKTSLLDALRSTDIVTGEHGGITQHIGAYKVYLCNDKSITFLDTPGHEAFTEMRMRGSKITDIVIIVIAADDGVKDQTIEAIDHAKAAKVPIIVAINKIDRPSANIEKVANSLFNYELVPENMGGEVIVIPVSAKDKKGLKELEDAILIQAEMLELKANYNRHATGTVIESKVDKTKGPIATLLIQNGTLEIGDIVVIGDKYFKTRALIDDKGIRVLKAIPSTPVEVLGLSQTPKAGEAFSVVKNEKIAKKITEFQMYKNDKNVLKANIKPSLETLLAKQAGSNLKSLTVILKTDVHGSLEAIKNSLQKLLSEEIELKIAHAVVGSIAESDISLAKVTGAIVLGFNVRADNKTVKFASVLGVDIRYYSVIYDLIDDVRAMINGLVSPLKNEKTIGYAEVRQVFNLTKHGKVAGCMVTEGIIKSKCSARLLRDNIVVYDGKLSALKRFKDDVKEVKSGFECGISFEKFNDIKEKDMFEAYEIVETQGVQV